MMVAAVEHGTGLVLGQVQVGDKTNEIPAVRELTRALDFGGRTVTLDALHAQQETARPGGGLRRRPRGHRREGQPGDYARRPAGDRLERGAPRRRRLGEGPRLGATAIAMEHGEERNIAKLVGRVSATSSNASASSSASTSSPGTGRRCP